MCCARALAWCFVAAALLRAAGAPAQECFKITVVDEATGRGVPLVELRTTNDRSMDRAAWCRSAASVRSINSTSSLKFIFALP